MININNHGIVGVMLPICYKNKTNSVNGLVYSGISQIGPSKKGTLY